MNKLKQELNYRSSKLESAEEKCRKLQQTLRERFAERRDDFRGGSGGSEILFPKEETRKVEEMEKMEVTEVTEELEGEMRGSKERVDVRELIRALAATKRELHTSRAGLSEAQQHISDLTWQNTSLRHDAFMSCSTSKLRTTHERTSNERQASFMARSTAREEVGGGEERRGAIDRPSTLKEYVTNTRTLTQVLANTTPLRRRLEASTAAFQRRSQRLLIESSNHSNRFSNHSNRSNNRLIASPEKIFYGVAESSSRPNILTPMHTSDLNEVRSNIQTGSDRNDELILDTCMDLSRALNPLGYHEHLILEGDL
jgi:hypothetical protein